MDKNILFLILTLVCVYLIMSEFFGQKYITTKNLWSPCVIADKNIKLPDFVQKYYEYFDKK